MQIRRLRPDAIVPRYQTADAAGMDLHAALDAPVQVAPGAAVAVPTGLAMAIPRGFEGQVRPRSGLASRHGVTVLNTPGTVDADYRGEIQVILINLGSESFAVERGQRIAQLVIAPVFHAQLLEAQKLGKTSRGAKGFGSTGKGAIDKKPKNRL